jgi:hypothetical protein
MEKMARALVATKQRKHITMFYLVGLKRLPRIDLLPLSSIRKCWRMLELLQQLYWRYCMV